MLADLNEDDRDPLSGILRCDGSIKNIFIMASCDFEYMLTMIRHGNINKRRTADGMEWEFVTSMNMSLTC